MGDDSSGEQCTANIPTMVQGAVYNDCTTNKNDLKKHFRYRDRHRKQVENMILLLGNSGTQGTASLRERTEAPLPPPTTQAQIYSPEAAQSFS